MQQVNPVVIPRNHLIEAFIQSAITNADYSEFESMLNVVTTPFDQRHLNSVYSQPPQAEQRVTQTFCGT